MLFIERPITLAHIRDFCGRFNEGLRVEYKRNLDANVREKLPKVVSSFANSHGGVLVVGVDTLDGVPRAPFEGFEPPAREEFALTVENICLQNINPPVLPRTTMVLSDVPKRVFLVVEVEESGEAPHAIENSKKVYVRTGNAANPYDAAAVDLIIDLVKRRKEPLELRDRLTKSAEGRAGQVVGSQQAYSQVAICPRFPRSALCSSEEVYDFIQNTRYLSGDFINRNYLSRVPDGVAGQIPERAGGSAAYEEINRFGLLFARTQFHKVGWQGDAQPILLFRDLFFPLCKFLYCAHSFYRATGFHGGLLVQASLRNVANERMTFYRIENVALEGLSPNDFRCIADVVSTERFVGVDRIVTNENKFDVLTSILAELAWSFWQAFGAFPRRRLDRYAADTLDGLGLA